MLKKKILLITHQTSKTGAPYTILLIFKEILKKQNIELDVFALSSLGDLKNEFKEISSNFYSPEKYYNYRKTFYEKILSFLRVRTYDTPLEIVKHEILRNKYDYIYANTVVTIPIAIELNESINAQLIAHIHELNHAIQECLPDLKNYIEYINYFFVPSELNKKLLVNQFQVPIDKISICRAAASPPENHFKLKSQTDIFNVYMCGTANWRKGEDLFLTLANSVVKTDCNIHFYWVGEQNVINKIKTEIELLKLKTQDNIHFLGESKNVYEIIEKMNCFILTSREDPFPLAAIEAGMAGLPIICFDRGNGIQEILDDSELIVEYLNIDSMKNKILELKSDHSKTRKIGELNKKKFSNYTPQIVSNEILKCFN